MKQRTVVAIILGVLLLISIVQAFQLNSLKEKISDGQLSISSSASKTPVASGGSGNKVASLPSSIKELPQMVGGC